MRIHHHASVDAKRVAQDDIRRLTTDAGEVDQLRHGLRHVAVVFFNKRSTGVLDALGFIAKEADAPDVILQFLQRHGGVVDGFAVFFEQLGGNDVDLFIGTLRGQNCGHHQLQWIAVIQLTMRIGIGLLEPHDDVAETFAFGGLRFTRHAKPTPVLRWRREVNEAECRQVPRGIRTLSPQNSGSPLGRRCG